MRSSRYALALASVLGVIVAVGCGSSNPPYEDDQITPVKKATPVQNTIAGGADAGGGDVPPGCGTDSNGDQCGCVDVPLYDDPPNIYFLLDHSGSMADDDKWDQVRTVVADVMRSLGPRANFGAMSFPGNDSNDQCAGPTEILPVTEGDPPSSTQNGPAVTKLLAGTNVPPNGGTPTAVAVNAVQTRLTTVNGKSFVVVATDGAPNCDLTATCDASQCQLNIESYDTCTPNGPNCCVGEDTGNCNDGAPTIAAITALKNAGFPVYVIGLPGAGDGAYAALLDQMAVAGGVPQAGEPQYFAVSSTASATILATFKKIAAQITGTCVYTLKAPVQDPTLVNVYLDNVVLPADPTNGWAISGTTVTLVGSACDSVKNGDVLDVRIIVGCPTVLPK